MVNHDLKKYYSDIQNRNINPSIFLCMMILKFLVMAFVKYVEYVGGRQRRNRLPALESPKTPITLCFDPCSPDTHCYLVQSIGVSDNSQNYHPRSKFY